MKKIFLLLIGVTAVWIIHAQVPQGVSYQAVARDQSGDVLKNTNITVRLAIRQGGPDGEVVWQEDHAVTTNDFGLFTLVLGDPGATATGGTLDSFDEIDWGAGDYFLQVSLDAGEGFQAFDPVPFLSVPYAKVAGHVTGGWQTEADTLVYMTGSVAIGTSSPNGSKLAVQGDDVNSPKPLFEVKRKDGQTVFAVYNDSIRMYVDATPGKGPRGGFAIGGFDAAKGPGQEYLRITPDSVRIYIDQSQAKGPSGGFAIGGFDAAKGSPVQLMHLDKDNYFIGHQSGSKITTGLYNQFFGYRAGMNTTEGSYNVFNGFAAGLNNTQGNNNIMMGNWAGYYNQTGSGNVMIGYQVGARNNADQNVFLGFRSGWYNTTGTNNVFIGYNAGSSHTPSGTEATGSNNVFLGTESGSNNTSGSNNVFIGDSSGVSNVTGKNNVFIGTEAGMNSAYGSDNIYIGYQSGYSGSGRQNISIGNYAGYSNQSSQSLFIGEYAGEKTTTGDRNSFVGFFAGQNNVSGAQNAYFGQFAGMDNLKSFNTFVGYWSGGDNIDGEKNAFFGYRSGRGNNGSNNVFLGYRAGEGTQGSGNVFIGYEAGSNMGTKSNILCIDNSNTSSPMIYGDFDKDLLHLNANIGVGGYPAYSFYGLVVRGGTRNSLRVYSNSGQTGEALYVNGDTHIQGNVTVSGNINSNSDRRFKKNIVAIENPVEKVMQLKGVSFFWKTNEELSQFSGYFKSDDEHEFKFNFPRKKQVGLIAQDVEQVLPEIVQTDKNGFKSVDYTKLGPLLIEAVKEQQKEIELLKQEIEALKAERK